MFCLISLLQRLIYCQIQRGAELSSKSLLFPDGKGGDLSRKDVKLIDDMIITCAATQLAI